MEGNVYGELLTYHVLLAFTIDIDVKKSRAFRDFYLVSNFFIISADMLTAEGPYPVTSMPFSPDLD